MHDGNSLSMHHAVTVDATLIDLTWLFCTKRCERMSWERSLGDAEEEV